MSGRRFELKATGSTKFWSAQLRGPMIEVKWGIVGGPTKVHDRRFTSMEEAEAKLEEMVASRINEGYSEVSDPGEVIATIPKHERWARRFQDKDRFLELVLDGPRVQQRRGRIEDDDGSSEVVQLVEHPSADDAREIVERIIKLATKDGFVLVRESDPPPLVMPGTLIVRANPELEALCRAAPEDVAPWEVYADWLMAHEDVRGELAALRMKAKESEATEMFRANRLALFGQHDQVVETTRVTSWRHGFATGIGLRLTYDTADHGMLASLTETVLAAPIGTFVECVRFGLAGFESNNDWGSTIEAVASSKQAAQIRELRFDDFDANECEISWAAFGDFSNAWARLPALEALHIRSGEGGTLGDLVLPNLKTFVRESGGLRTTEIGSICNATWPKLEHLEIWFGSTGYGAEGSVESIRRILDGKGLPALRHLGLVNCEFIDTLIGALARSKILAQVRTLDLSKGMMALIASRALVEHAAAFRHLAKIDLGENMLREAELAPIRHVLPNVVADDQREREDDDDEEDGYRYVAVGE